ncbi:MAG: dihydrofolate reductase [Clostridia bacterium]|nr:dihydrofolate reductase [Clostridia bacterium]
MKAIVAADNEWGIGKGNQMLYRLPLDMKYFREQTTGKVVVMGRLTLESFKDSKPLPNRVNIVLTSHKIDGCTCVANIDELFAELEKYLPDDVFVIGGAMVYELLIKYCDAALVTKVDAVGGATRFFPNLDEMDNWKCVQKSEKCETNGIPIVFCEYANTEPVAFRR